MVSKKYKDYVQPSESEIEKGQKIYKKLIDYWGDQKNDCKKCGASSWYSYNSKCCDCNRKIKLK